jgi:hypothetical protein
MASHPGEGPERRAIVAATHGDEQGRIVCKLLGQLLWCGGAEINANLLHDGKNLWMHSQSWLGAGRYSGGLAFFKEEKFQKPWVCAVDCGD